MTSDGIKIIRSINQLRVNKRPQVIETLKKT